MFTNLSLNNFRAFEELSIPLTKINVFLGPNNSGKSSVLSAINLISQTFQSTDLAVPLLFKGKYEDLGTYQDIIYSNDINKDLRLSLEFTTSFPEQFKNEKYKLFNNFSFGDVAKIDLNFHYRKQQRRTVLESTIISSPSDNLIMQTQVTKSSENQLINKINSAFTNIPVGKSSSGLIRLNHFYPNLSYDSRSYLSKRSRKNIERYGDFNFLLNIFQGVLHSELTKLEFIGPFRQSPLRIYPFSGEAPSSVGPQGENTINILASDESRRRGKRKGILKSISSWLSKAQIAESIQIKTINERSFTFLIKNYNTGEIENLADVGYGCSQILPILAAGYNILKGYKMLIEQPELHLHPKAQAEIGTFLYEMYNKDVQLFIETHSEHLLLRLQCYVAAGLIAPEDINVFYIYANDSKKVCKRLPLGADGYFQEDWPEGFFPERLIEAKKIAKKIV
jgi:predicted ATPase